ncbi:nephrin-like isoform X2 [Lineus longissimus]|uniref:nephrin-like isoform X2 n=1 Tax=Lineus longissimus TaxID=88925 RepID=UPI00315D5696
MAGKDMTHLVLHVLFYSTIVNSQVLALSVYLESDKTVTNAGEHVTFICTATEHQPAPELHYYRIQTGSTTKVDMYNDYILSKADNQARFYCEAKVPGYPEKNTVSETITITVKFNATRITMTEKPPNSVGNGDLVSLKCRTDSSYPGAEIEWLKFRPGWQAPQQIYTSIKSKQDRADFGTVQESEHNFLATRDDGDATYVCKIKETDIQSTVLINVTFPHTGTELKGDHTTASPLNSPTTLHCRTDESNPAAVLKLFELTYREGAAPSWNEVKDNITSQDVPGHYGGTMTVSSLSLKATKALNSRKYKCMSVYSSGNESMVLNSSIATIKVKWAATEVLMTDKPLHPINVGEAVNITCETSSSQSGPPGEFDWFKNGQPVPPRFTISESSSERDGVDYYVSSLQFAVDKIDNQASFECRINVEKAFRKEVTVQVFFIPDGIKLSDSLITSWEGDRNTLVCETTSSSNPPVILSMWKAGKALDQRVGPDVTDGDNGGYSAKVEVLVDTSRSDNGVQYLCIATYMNTLTLLMPARNNVKFNPTNISITDKPTRPLLAGEIFPITCKADSANPAADILVHRKRQGHSWENITVDNGLIFLKERKKDGAYNGEIRTSQIRVNATRHDNGAEFRCLVRDQAHGFEVMDTALVEVFYPPILEMEKSSSIMKEGAKLVLTCKAFAGNPSNYTYSWYHNDILISGARESVYRVENVSNTQGGTYRCEVRNYSPGGAVSIAGNIDVQYKPRWNPQFSKIMTKLANLNEWVQVTGNSDFGYYIATVMNGIGVTVFEFMLVKDAATTPMTSSMNITEGNENITQNGVNATGLAERKSVASADSGSMIRARFPIYMYVLFVLFAAHLPSYT